jgi:hypothetical protein
MIVQREDTTEMGTILLEEVYQGCYVKLESSQNCSRMMLSEEVKLYEIVGPQVKSCMWILKNATYK